MRNDGVRIVKATVVLPVGGSGYDSTHSYMYGYDLDLSRKTAALMRQSHKSGDERSPESRLRQEGLVRIAIEIRADHDPDMVIECDEGSGVSGQKKIYERPKMLELWEGIQNSTVGSVIVAREDRLFRDRFLTQVTQFAKECSDRGVLLIVAGRRCYDFRVQEDYDAFIRKMQEAYSYIDGHVRYMHQMKQQKLARGEWVGGGLIVPYCMDRSAIQLAREQRKAIKEYGGSAEEEAFITQAFRPVIYKPWQPVALDLFEKFKLFDFSRSRLGRYVEARPYLFPLPIAEDIQRYIFRVHMHLVPGLGYTFVGNIRLSYWICNLAHLGYASAGKDKDGNHVYIEDAFPAAIPRDLFEECYEAITGFTIDGQPSAMVPNHSRFVRGKPTGRQSALLTQRFTAPDTPMSFQARYDRNKQLCYFGCLKRRGDGSEESRLSYWDSNLLWTLPTLSFDRAIVNRLTELANHDKELASRVEKYYTELTKSKGVEKNTIHQDITRLEALIARYDQLLTSPAQPLTVAQEKRYLEAQADAERELEKAQVALIRYEQAQPNQFIPTFYRILGEAPGEFWNLSIDHQRRMLHLLVEEIQVKNISPHLYKVLLKWKDPVAQRWDCAIIIKRNAVRSRSLSEQDWEPEEEQILREIYPTASKLEIYKALPTKSGSAITARAHIIGVQRDQSLPVSVSMISPALCYADWIEVCNALDVDHTTQEGKQVLKTLNYYVRHTEKRRSSFWWILPVVEMNALDSDVSWRGYAGPF